MGRKLFKNVNIFDGTGKKSYAGEVLVQGNQIKKVAKENGLKKVPITVFEGEAGPSGYKIAKDADVTVMMWVNSEVKVNHSYAKGEMCSECVKTVVADIPKILK